jgi:hypothetical protein
MKTTRTSCLTSRSTMKLRTVEATLVLLVAAATTAAATLAAAPSTLSIGEISAHLAGSYDNATQVLEGKAQHPPPQHVTITIESTPQSDWQLWRVHMDVDADVADSAGSDTSLDALWAVNIAQTQRGIELIPYTLKAHIDPATAQAAAFDRTQWLALAACSLTGNFTASKIAADVRPDEMCAAATMGLGGKRAFLPMSVRREGHALKAQLTYFGRPWQFEGLERSNRP